MPINYEKVIRGCVGPKLAYHGFRCNEQESDPPAGFFRFTRQFFGKWQYVEIQRDRYLKVDLAELRAEGVGRPTRVHRKAQAEGERGYYLWLSNRYILILIHHEDAGQFMCHGGRGTDEGCRWEYNAEGGLRRALKEMVGVALTEGLGWLEEQVAETRRHHEKLDARRMSEMERRQGRETKRT